jgi:hypothetical protein
MLGEINMNRCLYLMSSAALLNMLATANAAAVEWQFSGFVRSDTAFNTAGQSSNPFNQDGNPFNGVPTDRDGLFPDTVRRPGPLEGQTIDLQQFRAELDATGRFNDEFSLVGRMRVVGDPGAYNSYTPPAPPGGGGESNNMQPNYFGYSVPGNTHPNPLEWADRNYMVDFPALFGEYNSGPLDLRVGNQQIAWGQAIFFRVLDVPDGLDYRRHSLLDYVPEEFSDKRVPALAVRASYQVTDDWLADAFVEKFQPTVYPNQGTPYNFIASQFNVRDDYAKYDADTNEGIRVKGSIGDIGLQFVYSHRYNPDGVYRWTASGVDRDIPGLPGSGLVLEHTPFEVNAAGVYSASEWFEYAAMSRLNGLTGLNAAITDFEPYTSLLGAVPVPNMAYARQELDTFFQLAGGALLGEDDYGLVGHIAREYRQEDDIGGGASYVTSGPPGSLLDQLIINVEALYVPNRTFTAPDLDVNFIRKPEVTTAVVLEKYQRISQSFPATYFVAQFLYKSQSDLFGRYIGGMGGTDTKLPNGYGGGFKAVAFALQQPFPNLIWRFDFAALYDLKGGLLLQPAIRWKPSGSYTLEAFYNYINGRIGNNPNDNIFGGIQYANEVSLRLTYQF